MTPPSHPCDFAWPTQLASVDVSMKPLLASPEVAGLPITSLSSVTPEAAIWKRAELGHVLEDAVRRPLQVVYSEVPSMIGEDQTLIYQEIRKTYGCRTKFIR